MGKGEIVIYRNPWGGLKNVCKKTEARHLIWVAIFWAVDEEGVKRNYVSYSHTLPRRFAWKSHSKDQASPWERRTKYPLGPLRHRFLVGEQETGEKTLKKKKAYTQTKDPTIGGIRNMVRNVGKRGLEEESLLPERG